MSRIEKTDTEILDFLSDVNQSVANVMLPAWAVEDNIGSLRDAIIDVMIWHESGQN